MLLCVEARGVAVQNTRGSMSFNSLTPTIIPHFQLRLVVFVLFEQRCIVRDFFSVANVAGLLGERVIFLMSKAN